MTKLRVHSFAISLDGYGAGPDQDLANPLGVGGIALHRWVFDTRTFQQMSGHDGGATGIDDDFAARVSPMSELGFWVGTCLGPSVDLGPTTLGRGGGAPTHLTTLPSSSSPTILAHR
jgi:hypothetical protein